MKKTVFIINGSGGCGKDTVVSIVDEAYYTTNIDSVAIVKNVAIQLGWDGIKSEENRLFLSELKSLADRHFNHSFRYVTQKISEFLDSKSEVAFIHIREPQGIEKVRMWCEVNGIKCHTILVENSNVETISTNKSDKNVSDYIYDIQINNNGTLDDLRNTVNKIIGGYLK